jgi:hypothetical protein
LALCRVCSWHWSPPSPRASGSAARRCCAGSPAGLVVVLRAAAGSPAQPLVPQRLRPGRVHRPPAPAHRRPGHPAPEPDHAAARSRAHPLVRRHAAPAGRGRAAPGAGGRSRHRAAADPAAEGGGLPRPDRQRDLRSGLRRPRVAGCAGAHLAARRADREGVAEHLARRLGRDLCRARLRPPTAHSGATTAACATASPSAC